MGIRIPLITAALLTAGLAMAAPGNGASGDVKQAIEATDPGPERGKAVSAAARGHKGKSAEAKQGRDKSGEGAAKSADKRQERAAGPETRERPSAEQRKAHRAARKAARAERRAERRGEQAVELPPSDESIADE